MADGSSGTTDVTKTAVSGLQDCMREVVLTDPEYALCIMNSGVFVVNASLPVQGVSVDAVYKLVDTTTYDATYVNHGECQLRCSAGGYSMSSSCCDTVNRVHSCELSYNSTTTCKEQIDSYLSYTNGCEDITSSTLTLIIVLPIILAVLALLYIIARAYNHINAKKVAKKNDTSIESSLDALQKRRSGLINRILTAVTQTTNLMWKNLLLRRRKPISLIFEYLLPLLLTTGLVLLANLNKFRSTSEIYDMTGQPTDEPADIASNETLFCTATRPLDSEFLGGLDTTLTSFYTSGQSVLGLFFLLTYIKFVASTTTTMVLDKETRMREVMRIMGLNELTQLLSHIFSSSIMSLPLSLALAAELKYGNVFPNASYATIVFVFWSLSFSIVCFSYCITPFFHKSRTAATVSVLLWLLLFFPFFSAQQSENSTKYASALAPPTAFSLAIDDLLRHALYGSSFAYSIAIKEEPITVPTAVSMCCFLIMDSVILIVLGWYLDNVIPQQFGVPKPWHFPYSDTVSYFRPKEEIEEKEEEEEEAYTPTNGSEDTSGEYTNLRQTTVSMSTPIVEPVSQTLLDQKTRGHALDIVSLRKVFEIDKDETKVAVHDVNLTLYSGQITALLGHNGAGKTTLISMLTGLLPPTSGDARLFHRSIASDLKELRTVFGICPQHDVLLDNLTVLEHIKLFGTMKHVPSRELNKTVDDMLTDVGLYPMKDARTSTLSGGQKRKLSVALAFIGDSRLVFLDEPTSGMDPYSRRFTWKLIQRRKEGRVIVLTTHFMDEAEILGDRVAIMSDGELQCVGSPLFLKSRFGSGYTLTLLKANAACTLEPIDSLILSFVPNATRQETHGSEIVYQLPAYSSSAFPNLLQALDAQLPTLQLATYGISVGTLEDVFLTIARGRDESRSNNTQPHGVAPETDCRPSFCSQYAALFIKRLQIAKRDLKSLLNAVLIPLLLLVIIAALPYIDVTQYLPNYSDIPSTSLQEECQAQIQAGQVYTMKTPDDWCATNFVYCSLGIGDCDASVCCDVNDYRSPFWVCSQLECQGAYCWNSACMGRNDAKLEVTLNSFLVALLTMLAFAFVPAAIVAFVVHEKHPGQNAKSLQVLSGTSHIAYWLSNWTYDMILVCVSVIGACILLPFSSPETMQSSSEVHGIIVLVITHAAVIVPLAYLFSRHFTEHAKAQTSVLVFTLATGGILSIFSFLCRVVSFSITDELTLADLDRNYLKWIFLLFPGYSFTDGLFEIGIRKLSRNALYGASRYEDPSQPSFFGLFEGLGKEECTECWNVDYIGQDCCIRHVFDVDVATAPAIYAAIETVLFIVLLLYLESSDMAWKGKDTSVDYYNAYGGRNRNEDEDVALERHRVEHYRPGPQDNVFIRGLSHRYQRHGAQLTALNNLSLSIQRGECFGYLGINGAGKSTTMKILTGQIVPTNGFAAIAGHNLAIDRNRIRQMIGYCPQFDALHDLLTVREQILLYARIKGISRDDQSNVVDAAISDVGLDEYRTKLTGSLSGGNKRKVSTAIALLGNPRIVFLDEPSTGVDPSSRRKLWNVISRACAMKGCSVLLTTHSMEECEALCHRVGILVGGELQCIGGVEHLKQKFGQGFTVEVKLSEPPQVEIDSIQQLVTSLIEGEDKSKLAANQVAYVCSRIGEEYRAGQIERREGSAWLIGSMLDSGGRVPIDVFCSWIATERQHGLLRQFFGMKLVGSVIVEQQGDHFRFQIPKQGLRPHNIFGLLEQERENLHIAEYSVSDTSLEHIFNNMASKQDRSRGEDFGYNFI